MCVEEVILIPMAYALAVVLAPFSSSCCCLKRLNSDMKANTFIEYICLCLYFAYLLFSQRHRLPSRKCNLEMNRFGRLKSLQSQSVLHKSRLAEARTVDTFNELCHQ